MKNISKRWIAAVSIAVALAISAGTLTAIKTFGSASSSPAQSDSQQAIADLAQFGLTGGSSPSDGTDARIMRAEAEVRRSPGSAQSFVDLAAGYMQKARETLDVTYYTLTAKSLDSALRIDPNNYAALTYDAWVHLARHDFAGAATLSQKAIQANPYDDANYGSLGDALANLGNYKGMTRAYQKEVNLKPSLASYNRASYGRWLYGDPEGAFQMMWLAIRAGSTSPENLAWCYSQLGDDYMAQGFVPAAEAAYKKALHIFPHYAPAFNGLAGIEIAHGHLHAAVRDYQRAIAIVPQTQYVTNLQDLYSRLGDTRDAQKEATLIGFIEKIYALNKVQYGVEEAMYDADHDVNLGQALQIARSQLQTRKDIKTWDTYAWVLYKNGRFAEAWKAEQQAMRLGTKDSSMYFHAGMILAKLRHLLPAQTYLSNALMTNPNFHVLYPAVARDELRQLSGALLGKPAKG